MHQILDRDAALQRLGNDEETYREVVEVFVADVPNQISALRKAWEERDVNVLHRAAHSLKSAAANVGGESLRSVCYEFEQLRVTILPHDAQSYIDKIEKEFSILRSELERLQSA